MALQALLDAEENNEELRESIQSFVEDRAATMLEPEYNVEVDPRDGIFLPHFALGIGLDDGVEHLLAGEDSITIDDLGILARVQERVQQMMEHVEQSLSLRGGGASALRSVQSIEVRKMALEHRRRKLTLGAAVVHGVPRERAPSIAGPRSGLVGLDSAS